jgi:hypothetical protein
VTGEGQLQWEARLGRPAAVAAFAAGLLLLSGTVVLLSIPEGRERIEARPDFLLSIDQSPGSFYAATALQAAAALCMIGVFYYLFRATIHREPVIPRWFVYLIVLGPAMYAAAQLLSATTQIDVAEMFAERDYSFEGTDDEDLQRCPAIRGDLGSDCAAELLQENTSGAAIGLGFAGTVSIAFLFVMLPLRARRAGLLTPFMAILGVIAGVLFVLPLFPGVPVVIQAFWLGALGALFLGYWPGGRGPAWDSGKPDPWPSAAEKRGLVAPPQEEAAEEAAPAERERVPEERERVPERPSSRKRKRKRR